MQQLTSVPVSTIGPAFSPLPVGTMMWGEWGAKMSTAAMIRVIEQCLDNGLTTFDHADIYGGYTTEAAFGAALRELPAVRRDQLQHISKCGIRLLSANRPANRLKSYATDPDYITASVERSLTNLGIEQLDLLLLHRPDPLLDPAAVAEIFQQLRQEGKVAHFGVSNFSPAQFSLLHKYFPLVTNQVECSPLHSDPIFDGTFDQALRLKFRPLVWGPLGGGKYFQADTTGVLRLRTAVREVSARYGGVGEDVILFAWLLRHPAGLLPLVGSSKIERILAVTAALELRMDAQDWFHILEAARGKEVA